MRIRRDADVTTAGQRLLRSLLEAPTFEIIPVQSAMRVAGDLPNRATVAITASPGHGLDATVELTEALASADHQVVPHLAARMIRDRAHLRAILTRLSSAGVDRVFVVGGDAQDFGCFPDGLSLLREMADMGRLPSEVGIPCYPQGHAFISHGQLLDALIEKSSFATHMTTQLCFDPGAIAAYIADLRADGIELPVHIGVPGVVSPERLLVMSARVGVRDTRRFVVKNTRLVGRLLRSGGFYRPNALLEGVAGNVTGRGLGVTGLHFYTFNAIRETMAWRQTYLSKVAA